MAHTVHADKEAIMPFMGIADPPEEPLYDACYCGECSICHEEAARLEEEREKKERAKFLAENPDLDFSF